LAGTIDLAGDQRRPVPDSLTAFGTARFACPKVVSTLNAKATLLAPERLFEAARAAPGVIDRRADYRTNQPIGCPNLKPVSLIPAVLNSRETAVRTRERVLLSLVTWSIARAESPQSKVVCTPMCQVEARQHATLWVKNQSDFLEPLFNPTNVNATPVRLDAHPSFGTRIRSDLTSQPPQ
jgi:hypothetical protein